MWNDKNFIFILTYLIKYHAIKLLFICLCKTRQKKQRMSDILYRLKLKPVIFKCCIVYVFILVIKYFSINLFYLSIIIIIIYICKM